MIKSRVTLKQLEALAFVVDTGTFRAAAEALGTTQPNISARIAALETTLGVVLMQRDAGSVRLTPQGEVLLAEAREVLRAVEGLIEAADRPDLIEERIRLGVTELVACTWLQPFLRRLRAAYPAVRVELQVDLSSEIERQLVAGQLDLALQSGPFRADLSGDLPLGSEPYIWAANADLAARLTEGRSIARFFEHTILTHARHTSAGRELLDIAGARGLAIPQIAFSSSLSACVPMAVDGMGIAVLPEALLHSELADARLVAMGSDWVPSPLAFHARFDAGRVPRYVRRAAELAVGVARASEDH